MSEEEARDFAIIDAILTDKNATAEDFELVDKLLAKYGLERDPERVHPSRNYCPKNMRRYVV